MAEKAGFKTVETDIEELNEKIRKHRRKIIIRVSAIVAILLIIIIAVSVWLNLRTFSSYEIKSTIETGEESASQFYDFNNNILEYSNDGAVYKSADGELIWNQAFEMTTPMVTQCKNYLVIYDHGGTELYIMNTTGIKKEIKTAIPIKTVCVASQGTVAVLMREKTNSFIRLYDQTGKELANGEFYGNQGCIPVDIALSHDAQKMAVDMIDITKGKADSNITFYNFGSVGQNEINNNVGSFTYKSTMIPEMRYVSEDTLIAIADNSLLFFKGTQKPKLEKTIEYGEQIESVFYNSEYIGVSYNNQDDESTHHICIYNNSGKLIMEHDTSVSYSNIDFLSNNEICINNSYECEIYTISGKRKFNYKFDVGLRKVIYGGRKNYYYFIFDGKTQEVHLR